MEVCEEETVTLFSEPHSRRTGGNRHRWDHGKFLVLKKWGDRRCPITVIKHWPALPREIVEYPSLGYTDFPLRIRLEKVLNNVL